MVEGQASLKGVVKAIGQHEHLNPTCPWNCQHMQKWTTELAGTVARWVDAEDHVTATRLGLLFTGMAGELGPTERG